MTAHVCMMKMWAQGGSYAECMHSVVPFLLSMSWIGRHEAYEMLLPKWRAEAKACMTADELLYGEHSARYLRERHETVAHLEERGKFMDSFRKSVIALPDKKRNIGTQLTLHQYFKIGVGNKKAMHVSVRKFFEKPRRKRQHIINDHFARKRAVHLAALQR